MAASTMNRAQRRAQKKQQQQHKPRALMSVSEAVRQVKALAQQQQWVNLLKAVQPMLNDHPQEVELHYHAALAYQRLGHLNEAIQHYQQLLAQQPGHAQSLYQLGTIMQQAGQHQQAIELYRTALNHQPKHYESYTRLLPLLLSTFFDETEGAFFEAVKHYPEESGFWRYFVNYLSRLEAYSPPTEVMQFLRSKSGMASKSSYSFATACAFCLLSESPTRRAWVQSDECEEWAALDDDLLATLLKQCIVPQLYVERLVKHVRQACLKQLADDHSSGLQQVPEQILLSLPHYFFQTEYLPFVSAEEQQWLKLIYQELEGGELANKARQRALLVIAACYDSLENIPQAEQWRSRSKDQSPELEPLWTLMYDEPMDEREIAAQIPGFGGEFAATSKQVQQQYEENPYPRWKVAGNTVKESPRALVTSLLAGRHDKQIDLRVPEEGQEVLIAGCGTGIQTVGALDRFPTAQITNIDLSRRSMAYAIRQMQALNISQERVEFLHGDILEAGKLNKQFDVIESVGVLHHMKEPLDGWKVLEGMLRPGGLMKIGLYSKAAREAIIRFREGWSGTPIESMTLNDIRTARQQLIDEQKADAFLRLNDFFAASECRDLLFHVQEHQFTIPQLQEAIDELGLEFLGFISQDHRIFDLYRAVHGSTQDVHVLSNWQKVEEAEPATFLAMYNFYLYKPV